MLATLGVNMSLSSATTALAQMRLDEPKDISEGQPSLISFEFSETLKKHYKDVLSFAFNKWGNLSFMVPPNFGFTIQQLHQSLGEYFNDPALKDRPKRDPKELRKRINFMLLMIVTRIVDDVSLMETIKEDADCRKCLADLALLHAYFCHEHIIDNHLSFPPKNDEELLKMNKNILAARSSFKRVDKYSVNYSNTRVLEELNILKQRVLLNIYRLECVYNPNALSFKELQFHLNRKNALAQMRNIPYRGELIFNPKTMTQHKIDEVVMDQLLDRIATIVSAAKPRTQFIVDILGVGHAMVLDVSYDPVKAEVQMINVEPACMVGQAQFLEKLIDRLQACGIQCKTVAIQTGLLKDYYSCYTFAFALSSIVSRLSFADLSKTSDRQPEFWQGDKMVSMPNLKNVIWRDVTALGKKAIMMGQSFSEMRANLLKLFPNQSKEVDTQLLAFKTSNGLGGRLPSLTADEAQLKSYIHQRRKSLAQKLLPDPYSDLTVPNLLQRLDTDTEAKALRLLASGQGSGRDLAFLLSKHPEVINEQGEKSGRTALHFAYDKGKLSRAMRLEEAGARQDIVDLGSKKPRDLKKA